MIRIEHLTRTFGNFDAVKDISLEIRKGEIFTLIGPSGCGKTTVLRLINLLDTQTSGKIWFDGIDTDTSEAGRIALRRRMGMVFQKPAVLNTTVAENVGFGLKFRGVPGAEIQDRVREALDLIGMPDFGRRRAVTLSGGEMQRVAIARAMVTRPEVLILYEPTANLDPVSSDLIEDLILKIREKFGTTIIISTHDMIQGQRLADRIAVIMQGRLAQTGSGTDIFYHPLGRDIARFVGIDPVSGGVIAESRNDHALIRIGTTCIEALTSLPEGSRVVLFIRPEEISLTPVANDHRKSSVRNQLAGRITRMLDSGPFIRVTADCGIVLTALITRRSCSELGLAVGSEIVASIKATAIHVLSEERK